MKSFQLSLVHWVLNPRMEVIKQTDHADITLPPKHYHDVSELFIEFIALYETCGPKI